MLIGVYRKKDPLTTLPEERIRALIDEAQRQAVQLFFFDAKGIDLERRLIAGTFFHEGERCKRLFPFPDVVLNEWPHSPAARPDAEQRLREIVPFTVHLIHNKLDIYRKLEKRFAEYLLPKKLADSVESLLAFLREHGDIVLKAEAGRKGNHIYRIRSEGEALWMHEGERQWTVTVEELSERVQSLLDEQRFLMQLYWPVTDEDNAPTDYRVHVQRDETGAWAITKLYPRIGRKGSVVSNISKGGSTMDIDAYLKRRYSERSQEMKRLLSDVALRLAVEIDSFYPFLIDELGIDLLMNDRGDIRFLEANSGPETRYHEAERAVRTIGFARYVGRAFHAGLAEAGPSIGLLHGGDRAELQFRESCAYVAKDYGVDFYCFQPRDVSRHFPVVKGYRLHCGQWEPRYVPYPSVVYDRLKERGKKSYAELYDRLRDIPFTEERKGGSVSKLKQYRLLADHPDIGKHIIPYEPVADPQRSLRFLEQWGAVIIKPSVGSLGERIVYIEAAGEDFLLQDHLHVHRLNRAQMIAFLTALAEKKGFLIQRFVRSVTKSGLPHYIRVHLIKNRYGAWEGVEPIMYVSADADRNNANHSETFWMYSPLLRMLKHEFDSKKKAILEQINRLALETAKAIEQVQAGKICEIGIDLGIDELGEIWIFEANLNKVGMDYKEMQIARIIIPTALQLVQNNGRTT